MKALKKAVKRFFKYAGIGIAALLSLIVLLAAFTQTQFFRDRLRSVIVSSLSESLNGSVYLGTIEGNFLTGFIIDSVAVLQHGKPLLTSGKISCRYDPLLLLRKRLGADYIVIEHPSIRIVRSMDGVWNIGNLLKSSGGSSGGTFDWNVDLTDIELRNASVRLIDSAGLQAQDHWNLPNPSFEYHDFLVTDLNLQMGASIHPDNLEARIYHVSGYSNRSGFELTHLKGEFSANSSGMAARHVMIQSGRSFVEFDALLKGADIFRGIRLPDLQRDSVHLTFKANTIDLAELRNFIPQIGFLDGSAGVDLDAAGEFGNLSIHHLNVRTLGNSVNLSGNIRNLHEPDQLLLDVLIGDSRLTPTEVDKILPGLHLPKLGGPGTATFFGEFSGKPVNFRTRAILKGEFGSLDLNGSLNLESKPPSYTATFSTRDLKLGTVFDDNKLHTILFTRGSLSGQGFTLGDLAGSVKLTVDSSRVQGFAVSSSDITLHAAPRKLSGSVALAAQGMNATIKAAADFTETARPRYSADLFLKSFDFSKLLSDPRYASDLTLQASGTGSGRTIDDFDADLTLTLLPSVFQDHHLANENVELKLSQTDQNNKHLSLRSSLADLDFDGRFDLDYTAAALYNQGMNLIRTVEEHARPPDTLHVAAAPPNRLAIHPHSRAQREMNFTYAVNMKSLDPLSAIIDGAPFNARGSLKGTIRSTADNLSLTCDGTLDEFFVGSVKGGVLLNDIGVTLTANSLSDLNTLEQLSGKLKLSIGSGLLNTTKFNATKVNLAYDRMEGKLSGVGLFDSAFTVRVAAAISIQPHTYAFDFDSLIVSTGDYSWHNEQDVQFRLNYDGVRVMHAVMRRNAESFSTTGVLHPDGEFQFDAALRKFDLTGLDALSRNPILAQPGQGFTGSADADLHLGGSLQTPIVNFTATTESTYFRQTRIGVAAMSINYRDQSALLDIAIRKSARDTSASLIVKGTLPINLALSGVQERFPDQIEHLEIVSPGFDVSVLDPLLADFHRLSGVVRCNLLMGGTPRRPLYEGNVTLDNLQFVFVPNNVGYIINGELQASGDSLNLQGVRVRNLAERGFSGEMTVSGPLMIKDFQVEDFDLVATGQFLLMTEASRRSIPSMFGALPAEIGPDGLHIKGPLAHPYLSGALYVEGANLIFPPTKVAASENSALTLNYVVIDDTARKIESGKKVSRFFSTLDTTGALAATEDELPPSPLLERLRYNLSIETRGTNSVTMIFTPATNEELYAELDGKVNAINYQGTPLIYGDIEISPRSYYNFFRRFDATGKLKFVGQWDNPELDIQATYEGYRPDPEHDSLEQKVTVQLNIGGTRYEPKLAMDMKVELRPGEEPVDWSTQAKGGDVQSDAISFILTGKFRDQLTSKDQAYLTSNFGSMAGGTVATNLLSGILTDVIQRDFPFIRRAGVTYGPGGVDVDVTATVYKGSIRVGGKILNDIGNANVSYQVSLGDVLNSTTIRNLYLEILRKVEGENPEDRKLTNEARLYYRLSF